MNGSKAVDVNIWSCCKYSIIIIFKPNEEGFFLTPGKGHIPFLARSLIFLTKNEIYV